jgi:hypothetical protein
MFEAILGKCLQDPIIFKITRVKWTGGVAQVVEFLLCKGKALNSNPTSTIKKEAVSELMTPLWSVIVCAPSFAAAVISNETMTTQVFW